MRGSICLAISDTRAVVIKIQLDLIWGTMATRGGKYVYNRVCTARCWTSLCKAMWLQVIANVFERFQQEWMTTFFFFFLPFFSTFSKVDTFIEGTAQLTQSGDHPNTVN